MPDFFCPTCGNQLKFENAEICPSCGVRIQPPPFPRELRSPLLAILLSLFFVGWGQWYNGKTWDGLKLLGAFLLSFFILLIFTSMMGTMPITAIFVVILIFIILAIWIYGIYDAYKNAERINNGEETFSGKSGLFWLPVALIILVMFLILWNSPSGSTVMAIT